MANPIKWQQAWVSRGNVVTTGANSLADSARSPAGTEIDNSSNLDQYGKLVLNVSYGSAPSAGGYVAVYMVTAPDGSTYEDGSDTVDPGVHNQVVFIPVKSVTGAQVLTSPIFAMQPAKTKFIVLNKAGTTMASSGNTLALFTSNDQVN